MWLARHTMGKHYFQPHSFCCSRENKDAYKRSSGLSGNTVCLCTCEGACWAFVREKLFKASASLQEKKRIHKCTPWCVTVSLVMCIQFKFALFTDWNEIFFLNSQSGKVKLNSEKQHVIFLIWKRFPLSDQNQGCFMVVLKRTDNTTQKTPYFCLISFTATEDPLSTQYIMTKGLLGMSLLLVHKLL